MNYFIENISWQLIFYLLFDKTKFEFIIQIRYMSLFLALNLFYLQLLAYLTKHFRFITRTINPKRYWHLLKQASQTKTFSNAISYRYKFTYLERFLKLLQAFFKFSDLIIFYFHWNLETKSYYQFLKMHGIYKNHYNW